MKLEGKMHSTRLKNRLFAHFHNFKAYQEGRDNLLACDEHVTDALKDAYMESNEDEAIHLAKASKLVCRDMLNMHTSLWFT